MNHEGKDYPILKEYLGVGGNPDSDHWELELLDADPRGGYMVRVTTFSGPGAEQLARAMYDSLR